MAKMQNEEPVLEILGNDIAKYKNPEIKETYSGSLIFKSHKVSNLLLNELLIIPSH